MLKLVTHLPTPASCKSIASRKRKEACLVEELEAYIHASLTFPKSFRTRVKSLRKTSYPLEVVIGTDGKVGDVKPLEGCPSFMASGVKVALRDMPAMEPGKLNGTARCVGVDVVVYPNRAAFSNKVKDDFSPTVSADEVMPPKGDDLVFKIVEEMPRFYNYSCETLPRDERKACADEAMFDFIAEKIEYPEEALEKGTEGVAVIWFVIEKDGQLTDIRAVRNPGDGTGEEAVRVVKEYLQGRFLPGKQKGKAVRVKYNLPVKFRLDGGEEAEEPLTVGSDLKEIFVVVEEMPRYFSADCEEKPKHQRKECASEAMLERIYDKMVYPQQALDQNEEGVAVVQFVVLPDGQVTSINLVRDPGFGMGAEAERLVREYLTEGWVPGKQRGRPVAVRFNLPVKFER